MELLAVDVITKLMPSIHVKVRIPTALAEVMNLANDFIRNRGCNNYAEALKQNLDGSSKKYIRRV